MRVSATRRSVWAWGGLLQRGTMGAAVRLTGLCSGLQAVLEGVAERRGIDSEEIANVAKREGPSSIVVEEPVAGLDEFPPPGPARVAPRKRAKGVFENRRDQRDLGHEARGARARILAGQQRRR